METERIAGLTAEIKGQLWLMEKVSDRLQSRVNDGLDTPGQLDSVVYQIHNLYCLAEDLLKLISCFLRAAFRSRSGEAIFKRAF